MTKHGVGAIISGGKLYFDSNQDYSDHLDAKNVFTIAASLILNLDAD